MANLSPSDGGPVSRKQARPGLEKYKQEEPPASGGKQQSEACFIGRDHIERLLKQPECVGIRIYLSINSDDQRDVVLVGAKEDGDNILPSDESDAMGASGGLLINRTILCPPFCASNSI